MVELEGVTCHFGCVIPPKGFSAITIFGHVFFRLSYNSACANYNMKNIIRHERIHIVQGNQLGWVVFYILYLYYWFIGLFKYGWDGSYYQIPFEREAYANQHLPAYGETHWRDYI